MDQQPHPHQPPGPRPLKANSNSPNREAAKNRPRESDPIAVATLRNAQRNYRANLVIVVALIVLILTIGHYARSVRNAEFQSRQSFEARERAYISLGGRDGTLAELKDANGKMALLLHFFNSGRTAATHLVVNAWSSTGAREPIIAHLRRYRLSSGAIESQSSGPEANVCAHCSYIDPLDSYWIPAAGAFTAKDIESSPSDSFEVIGEVEYCDVFGGYHCEPFSLRYEPVPADRFVAVAVPSTCRPDTQFWSNVPKDWRDQEKALRKAHPKTPITRCPQPGESDENQQSAQMTPPLERIP